MMEGACRRYWYLSIGFFSIPLCSFVAHKNFFRYISLRPLGFLPQILYNKYVKDRKKRPAYLTWMFGKDWGEVEAFIASKALLWLYCSHWDLSSIGSHLLGEGNSNSRIAAKKKWNCLLGPIVHLAGPAALTYSNPETKRVVPVPYSSWSLWKVQSMGKNPCSSLITECELLSVEGSITGRK